MCLKNNGKGGQHMDTNGEFYFFLVVGALTKKKEEEKKKQSRIYEYNIINIEFIQLY